MPRRETFALSYRGNFARPCRTCQVHVWPSTNPVVGPVVLVTQTDRSATSVTNAAEEIATLVWRRLGRPPVWTYVEHYSGTSPTSRAVFQSVTFERSPTGDLRHPRWTRRYATFVEARTGEPAPS